MLNPDNLVVDGWDISSLDLGTAMQRACVLDRALQEQLLPLMSKYKPRASIYVPDYIAANQVYLLFYCLLSAQPKGGAFRFQPSSLILVKRWRRGAFFRRFVGLHSVRRLQPSRDWDIHAPRFSAYFKGLRPRRICFSRSTHRSSVETAKIICKFAHQLHDKVAIYRKILSNNIAMNRYQ